MRVLGFDTATSTASVGIWVDGCVVAEKQESSRNHAASLLPLIDCVLDAAGLSISSLDLIAVSAGPGSFSGLRVGLSIAKGFALAAGVRVVAVSTLEALAATVGDRDGRICSLLDAHKGELYMGCFEAQTGRLQRQSEDAAVTVETVVALIPRPCIVVGDAVPRYGDTLSAALGGAVTLLPFPEFGPRGGTVAALAAHQYAARGSATAATLEPFYIRPPEVQVSI